MLVRLLVEIDMFRGFPDYGLEKEKKHYSLILMPRFLFNAVLTQ